MSLPLQPESASDADEAPWPRLHAAETGSGLPARLRPRLSWPAGILLAYAGVLGLLTHLPIHWPPKSFVDSVYGGWVEPFNKPFHVVAYGVLAGLLVTAWHYGFGRRVAGRPSFAPMSMRSAGLVFALVFVAAVVDEASQPWVGRVADRFDLMADMIGAFFGIALAMIAFAVGRRDSIKPQPIGLHVVAEDGERQAPAEIVDRSRPSASNRQDRRAA